MAKQVLIKTTREQAELASVEHMAQDIEKRYGIHWAERKAGPDGVCISNNKASTPLGEIFPSLFNELKQSTKSSKAASDKRVNRNWKNPPLDSVVLNNTTTVKLSPRVGGTVSEPKRISKAVMNEVAKSLEAMVKGDAPRIAANKNDYRSDPTYAVAFV